MNKDPNRATQFLAFAALSGFERLLEEREKAAQQEACGETEERTEKAENDDADSC